MKVVCLHGADKAVHDRWSAEYFEYIFLVKMLQIPFQRHFSNYEQSTYRALLLPSIQSINHKKELPQGALVFIPSAAENMLSGVTNSPTSAGSEWVSRPNTHTQQPRACR